MNYIINGDETDAKAYFSFIRCFYNFVFIVSSLEIDFKA